MKTNAQLVYRFNEVFKREQLVPLNSMLDKNEQGKLNLQAELIEEELQEIKEAILAGDWEGLKDGLGDLLVVAYGLGYVMSVDADEIVHRVNDANMSKLCKTQEEVLQTVKHYEDMGIVTTIEATVVDEVSYFIVKSKIRQVVKGKTYPEGKFLKNVNWKEPDLFGTEVICKL